MREFGKIGNEVNKYRIRWINRIKETTG